MAAVCFSADFCATDLMLFDPALRFMARKRAVKK